MDNLTAIFDLYELQDKLNMDDDDLISAFMLVCDVETLKDVKNFIEENYIED